MITEDAFSYHRGSASISKTSATVKKIVKKNKKILKKQGHNTAHWRLKNLAAIGRYVGQISADDPLTDLGSKVAAQ